MPSAACSPVGGWASGALDCHKVDVVHSNCDIVFHVWSEEEWMRHTLLFVCHTPDGTERRNYRDIFIMSLCTNDSTFTGLMHGCNSQGLLYIYLPWNVCVLTVGVLWPWH